MTLNEKLTLATSIGSFAVSLLTLGLGWAAYKKFLSQKLAETQLTVVLSFVEAIYQSVFYISIIHRRTGLISATSYQQQNLFQLSNGGKRPVEHPYSSLPVLALSSQLAKFKGWAYIRNPLLPNEISKELFALSELFYSTATESENLEKYVVLGNETEKDGSVIYWQQAKGDYKEFIEHCSALDLSIQSWLKKHGLHDLNQHVVNTSPFGTYTKQDYYTVNAEAYQMLQSINSIDATNAKDYASKIAAILEKNSFKKDKSNDNK